MVWWLALTLFGPAYFGARGVWWEVPIWAALCAAGFLWLTRDSVADRRATSANAGVPGWSRRIANAGLFFGLFGLFAVAHAAVFFLARWIF